jgi:hypothetical protein
VSRVLLVIADSVAIEQVDPPGRKVMLERDEILDPRNHPEGAVQTAIQQGLIAIVSAAEAEQATARLAQRWAEKDAPDAFGSDRAKLADPEVPVHGSGGR